MSVGLAFGVYSQLLQQLSRPYVRGSVEDSCAKSDTLFSNPPP